MNELTPEQKRVLREKGTEAPFSGDYVHKTKDGMYKCVACDNLIFSSDAQFDSGTGWPSFDQAILGAVKEVEDNDHGMSRIETVCAKCGSHLGHVFDDGPTKTGKRYCINSVCLNLEEKGNSLPKALAFDLDGTLASSKYRIEDDMVAVLCQLLAHVPIAVVSGASQEQFHEQFLQYFPKDFDFTSKLYIFPQNGAELIEYKKGSWVVDYENSLDKRSEGEIISALDLVIKEFGLKKNPDYGELVENRGDQITLSALGQKAPLELKQKWDPDQAIRIKMKAFLEPLLPDDEIRIGGATSIDITKRGIHKAYAMNYFIKMLNIAKENLLYIGDALFPGGNDEIVKKNGFVCQKVDNPQDTLTLLRGILQKYEEASRK